MHGLSLSNCAHTYTACSIESLVSISPSTSLIFLLRAHLYRLRYRILDPKISHHAAKSLYCAHTYTACGIESKQKSPDYHKSRLIFLRNIHLIRTLKNIAYVSIQPKKEDYRRYFTINAKSIMKYYFTDNTHSDIQNSYHR